MRPFIREKKGAKYGEWRVIKFHRIDGHGDARWWCKCNLCGEVYSVRGFALRNGTTRKCKPCAIRECRSERVI